MTPDYEAMLESYYTSILRPGDCCVDVGANVGRHTIPIARAVGAGGKVFAFEPLPQVNAELREAVARARDDCAMAEVIISELALGDTPGEAVFVAVNEVPAYSGFRERVYDLPVTTRRIKVQVARLDGAIPESVPVSYIKLDAEGGEYVILRGASGVVRRHRPIVTFECGDNSMVQYHHGAADIFDLLESWDYRVRDINQVELSRQAFIDSNARQKLWDYIAIPR